ncbi:hypothetical protein LF887_01330 [Chryseobacterium sp. MEBOG06]|uniref:hypothetical protein n=1 Tax=unclassified Chryseobacterium TaxID=2593645 RepID=UPI001F19EE4D|nr:MULTISPECIES: hypothetical protein [unclassified Chryseobacterium]UKB84324.1 hypothetical protein LF887_01330 [Chryseobacterium sp. MEBOG06]
MKKTILTTLILAGLNFSFGQQTLSINGATGAQSVFDGIKSTTGKTLKYDEIPGASPYLTKEFSNAKVAANYEQVPVRYNSYSDEVEFKKNNEIQVLPKTADFSRIEISSPKQTIVLLQTSDDLSGYFLELVNGKNSLYKKVKTKFTDLVPAANSYASDRPANFRALDPAYYIKTDKGFIKKPRNQKEIIEQFPDKKEALNTFFKSNKIKFDKDEDLIKLVTFLNQD